jgi:hypothetical protein
VEIKRTECGHSNLIKWSYDGIQHLSCDMWQTWWLGTCQIINRFNLWCYSVLTMFGPVNFSVFILNYITINSRLWFEPVISNFHFKDWLIIWNDLSAKYLISNKLGFDVQMLKYKIFNIAWYPLWIQFCTSRHIVQSSH